MQSPSLPSCPRCGGAQAFFKANSSDASLSFVLGFLDTIKLGALICLACGYAELHADPNDMESIRDAANKQLRRR